MNHTNIVLLLQAATQKYRKLRLLNKMLSLSALLSAYCHLRFLRLAQRQSFFIS